MAGVTEDSQLTSDMAEGGLNAYLSGRRTTFAHGGRLVAPFPREQSEESVTDTSEHTNVGEVARGLDQQIRREINTAVVLVQVSEDRNTGLRVGGRWEIRLGRGWESRWSRTRAQRGVCVGQQLR